MNKGGGGDEGVVANKMEKSQIKSWEPQIKWESRKKIIGVANKI